MVNQFFRYLFVQFLSPFLSGCLCVVLQVKRSLASLVFVKVQVIHFQDFGIFFAMLSFFEFEFFGLSLHLQVMLVIHFCITSGAKLCFGSVKFSPKIFSNCKIFQLSPELRNEIILKPISQFKIIFGSNLRLC